MLLSLVLASGRCPGQDAGSRSGDREPWSVLKLVQYHLSIRKNVGVQDVYKLLHQANFGVGHLLSDTSHVRSSIVEEIEGMDTTDRGELLIERISTSSGMVRINLRPFRSLNLPVEELVSAMFRSAANTTPDTLMFMKEWSEFCALVQYGLLSFPAADLKTWRSRVDSGDLGPVHHSEGYSASNAPAYRVALKNMFEPLRETDGSR